MGEWERSLGEEGERIVDEILDMVGWGARITNFDIPCRTARKHKLPSSAGPRRKHGIDQIYSVESQLVQDQLDIAAVSIKFSSKAYPASPVNTLKGYISDLAGAMSCFEKSSIYSDIVGNAAVSSRSLVGILFWLNSSADSYHDLIEKVKRMDLVQTEKFETIYVVDNLRAEFLYSAIHFINLRFGKQNAVFEYVDTGYATDPTNVKSYGRALPVSWINSNILPFRAGDDKSILVIVVNEPFSEAGLLRVMGFSLVLSKSWARQVNILFNKFSRTDDRISVERVRAKFADREFSSTVKVGAFSGTFRDGELI